MPENNNFPDEFNVEDDLSEMQKNPDVMRKDKKDKKFSIAEFVFEWLDSFVISLVAVVLLFTFFLGKVKVDGNSMNETLINNDQLIITYFNYTPSVGDIVIISRNKTNDVNLLEDNTTEPLVKRVIAVGNQTVEIKDGYAYVDGVKLEENYTTSPTYDTYGTFEGVHTVPEGCVFVMGDNRIDSHDSRASEIGMIDERYILGKVVVRIWPIDTFRLF